MPRLPTPCILVTGGAGFIGSHLCEGLLATWAGVLCSDNFITSRRANIAHLLPHPLFELMRHDVTFLLYVEIYNLACPASPIHYQLDPVQTIKTSVHGAINMLGLAKRTHARILRPPRARSMEAPRSIRRPRTIGASSTRWARAPATTKGNRCAETLHFDYHRQHRLRIKVARKFNTYGPRERPDDGRVVSNLIVQALSGQDLTLYGDGSQTRSFCYVDDLVHGLIRLMASPDEVTGSINLGNPAEFTIRGLAEKSLNLTGSSSRLVYAPQDDPTRRRPGIKRARSLLDGAPTTPVNKGLQQTVEYFRDLLESAS
jgi:UDP-glucuronate decarboxylase